LPSADRFGLAAVGDLDLQCWRVDSAEHEMSDRTHWDAFKAESESVLGKLKGFIHEGSVRRVVVKHEGRTVAEFPLTAGVVGAVLAPVLAAIGALVALLQDCTIEVEREQRHMDQDEHSQTAARS
jgi:hypothetical protein